MQTNNAHEAVRNVIEFTDDKQIENVERYLQALAIGCRPNPKIISDLLKVVEKKGIDQKIKTTIIQSLGSMAYRYANQPNHNYSSEIVTKVLNYLNNSISACKTTACYIQYLNGFNNLQSMDTTELLFEYVNDTDRSIAVAAAKALQKFPSSIWNAEQMQRFEDIFYQHEKRFDSSVRTLALDIILETKLSDEKLKKLIFHLKSLDHAFEVKKYLQERISMLCSEDAELDARVQQIIRKDKTLNNYHVLMQKGLTTALSRKFSQQSPFNGTLISIQEIFGGILKRGVVDMTVDSSNQKYSYFTVFFNASTFKLLITNAFDLIFQLGLYSGGLQSFVSSDSEQNEDSDETQDETANAGMEITVQNSYLRNLEFFRGQGELMGHVWSGTASEPTPAYVANSLLHDHHELVQLQNGATVFVDVMSALSIDLNGAIQLSLWNRNAQIQVNKK